MGLCTLKLQAFHFSWQNYLYGHMGNGKRKILRTFDPTHVKSANSKFHENQMKFQEAD